MSDMFKIRRSTLDNIGEAFREYLPFSPTIYYYEYVDFEEGQYVGIAPQTNKQNDHIVEFNYLPNNDDIVLPVLYKTDTSSYPDEPDTEDTFYYEGPAEIDGVMYDKWRKIELSDTGFTWDSDARAYIYTDVLVKDNVISIKVYPDDFPATIRKVYEEGAKNPSIPSVEETRFEEFTDLPPLLKVNSRTLRDTAMAIIYNLDEYSLNFLGSELPDKIHEVANYKYHQGYDEGLGNCSGPKLQDITVTPSDETQIFTADDGYDGISEVTVHGDSELVPANIVRGAVIFGVAGEDEGYERGHIEGTHSVINDLIEQRTSKEGLFKNCAFLSDERLNFYAQYLPYLGTNMSDMFNGCQSLTTIPSLDTSTVTIMQRTFGACVNLTTVPSLDTSNVTSFEYAFTQCVNLTTIRELDVRNGVKMTNMLLSCVSLKHLYLRNIKSSLQVASGTSYGHLLTLDSLVSLIYELRYQGSGRILTIGSANLEKLANVYVRTIEITDEMRAEDEFVDEKTPFERCESDDEGAILITDYIRFKNWSLQ